MNTQTQAHSTSGHSEFADQFAQLMIDTWSAIKQTMRDRRHRMLDRIELGQLDSHALRDLGISRSEFDSFHAESIVCAELTRRRVAWPWRDGEGHDGR